MFRIFPVSFWLNFVGPFPLLVLSSQLSQTSLWHWLLTWVQHRTALDRSLQLLIFKHWNGQITTWVREAPGLVNHQLIKQGTAQTDQKNNSGDFILYYLYFTKPSKPPESQPPWVTPTVRPAWWLRPSGAWTSWWPCWSWPGPASFPSPEREKPREFVAWNFSWKNLFDPNLELWKMKMNFQIPQMNSNFYEFLLSFFARSFRRFLRRTFGQKALGPLRLQLRLGLAGWNPCLPSQQSPQSPALQWFQRYQLLDLENVEAQRHINKKQSKKTHGAQIFGHESHLQILPPWFLQWASRRQGPVIHLSGRSWIMGLPAHKASASIFDPKCSEKSWDCLGNSSNKIFISF